MGAIHSHCAELAQPVENVWNLQNHAIGVGFRSLPCGNLSSFHSQFPRHFPLDRRRSRLTRTPPEAPQCSTWNTTPSPLLGRTYLRTSPKCSTWNIPATAHIRRPTHNPAIRPGTAYPRPAPGQAPPLGGRRLAKTPQPRRLVRSDDPIVPALWRGPFIPTVHTIFPGTASQCHTHARSHRPPECEARSVFLNDPFIPPIATVLSLRSSLPLTVATLSPFRGAEGPSGCSHPVSSCLVLLLLLLKPLSVLDVIVSAARDPTPSAPHMHLSTCNRIRVPHS